MNNCNIICILLMSQVDYELNTSTGTAGYLQLQSKENYVCNLAILLQWSPYSTEEELLKQVSHIAEIGFMMFCYS